MTVQPRETKAITLNIPLEALESLRKIAAKRDMSEQALLKFYIGQGLREDLSTIQSDHILEKTEEVLSKHIESKEEVSIILREIRAGYSAK